MECFRDKPTNITEFIKDLLMFVLLFSHQKLHHFLEDDVILALAFVSFEDEEWNQDKMKTL